MPNWKKVILSGSSAELSNLDVTGDITTTGNYSGSVNTNYFGDEFNAHGDDANSGFTLLSLGSKPQVYSFNSKFIFFGMTINS